MYQRTKSTRPCVIVGCPRMTRSPIGGDWCQRHYARWWRTGSTADPKRGARTRHSHGYYIVHGHHGHPLADKRGDVFEHRLVLYRELSGKDAPCQWCGLALSWSSTRGAADMLTVDHLDEDKGNNDPANLVPSCHPCNVRRSNRWARVRVNQLRLVG